MSSTPHRQRNEQETPLGTWIRGARLDQGLSQRELASRSGLSRSYVCDIERGRGAHPSMGTLDKLGVALGLSRIDLLKASGVIEPVENHRETEAERRMLAVFRDLSEVGRLSVMQYARFIHTDEHHWIQSNLLDIEDGRSSHAVDTLTRPMFESADR